MTGVQTCALPICKHRKFIDGEKCWYKKQWGEDVIDAAVVELITKLVQNQKFEKAIKSKIDGKIDTKELENEFNGLLKEQKKKESAISRLGDEIDTLNPYDKQYNRKYEDKQIRLNKLYDDVADIEEKIEIVKTRIESVQKQKITGESIYKILLCFDKLYDKFTDIQKKEFMKSFIDEIQIYEKPTEKGQF